MKKYMMAAVAAFIATPAMAYQFDLNDQFYADIADEYADEYCSAGGEVVDLDYVVWSMQSDNWTNATVTFSCVTTDGNHDATVALSQEDGQAVFEHRHAAEMQAEEDAAEFQEEVNDAITEYWRAQQDAAYAEEARIQGWTLRVETDADGNVTSYQWVNQTGLEADIADLYENDRDSYDSMINQMNDLANSQKAIAGQNLPDLTLEESSQYIFLGLPEGRSPIEYLNDTSWLIAANYTKVGLHTWTDNSDLIGYYSYANGTWSEIDFGLGDGDINYNDWIANGSRDADSVEDNFQADYDELRQNSEDWQNEMGWIDNSDTKGTPNNSDGKNTPNASNPSGESGDPVYSRFSDGEGVIQGNGPFDVSALVESGPSWYPASQSFYRAAITGCVDAGYGKDFGNYYGPNSISNVEYRGGTQGFVDCTVLDSAVEGALGMTIYEASDAIKAN